MPERFLQPNTAGDVRWGFLDRHDFNPYLARSLGVGALAVLVATAMPLVWPRTVLPPPPRVVAYTRPIDIHPVPDVVAVRPRVTQPVVRRSAVAPKPAPVPGVTELREIESDHATGGAGSIGESVREDAGSESTIEIDGRGSAAMPGPDTFVPFEAAPVLVTMPAPEYPEIAREAGIEGTVLVRVLVGADGFVHRVLLAAGVLGLDDAALAAAQNAVFMAARQQDRPVAVWVVIPIEFRLRE